MVVTSLGSRSLKLLVGLQACRPVMTDDVVPAQGAV